jgi:hypothetical protein
MQDDAVANGDFVTITPDTAVGIANTDASNAISAASQIKQPLGSTIYFAIDGGFHQSKNQNQDGKNAVEVYIKQIMIDLDSATNYVGSPSKHYVVGVYGPANVLKDLLSSNTITTANPMWLADQFGGKVSGITLEQKSNPQKHLSYYTKIGSLEADADVARLADFGQWRALTVLWQPAPSTGPSGDVGSQIALDPIFTTGNVYSLILSGIPEGATLSDGTHSFTAVIPNAWADVTTWLSPTDQLSGQLSARVSGLTLTDPNSGNVTLTATATEQVATGPFTAANTEAVTIKSRSEVDIDFDHTATGGTATTGPAASYLAGFGITVTNGPYGDPGLSINSNTQYPYIFPTSDQNFLQFTTTSYPLQCTLDFSTTFSSITFDRCGSSGLLTPLWSATAYDAQNNPVGLSVGEPLGVNSGTKQTFTIAGSGIKHLTLYGNDEGVAGASGPLLDTFKLLP